MALEFRLKDLGATGTITRALITSHDSAATRHSGSFYPEFRRVLVAKLQFLAPHIVVPE